MPDDQNGLPSLPPLPSLSPQNPPEEVLTDPVMPEEYTAPSAPPPTIQPLQRVAATPPVISNPSKSSSIAVVLLTLLALSGLAGAGFMYSQNQKLSKQVTELQSKPQETPEPTPIPEITPESTPSATPMATPSATPSPKSTGISAFNTLANIINIAQQESAAAQLLMITSDNSQLPIPTFKYWFRRGPNQKSYFFVQSGEEPKVFTSATVSPDNNIPDLIEYFTNNQLGIDVTAANQLAMTSVVKPETNSTPTQITSKYLRGLPSNPSITTPINLWQLTYKFSNHSDIVVQINAQTSQIVFDNLP